MLTIQIREVCWIPLYHHLGVQREKKGFWYGFHFFWHATYVFTFLYTVLFTNNAYFCPVLTELALDLMFWFVELLDSDNGSGFWHPTYPTRFLILAEQCHTHEFLVWLKNENYPRTTHSGYHHRQYRSLAEQCNTQNFYLRCFKSDFDAVKSEFVLLIK